MRTVTIAIILVLVLAGAAFAADAAAGKTVYLAKCKGCHGVDGAPNATIAKMKGVTMKALGSKEVQAKSNADLKKDSTAGVGKMLPVKLTDAEADNVVAFVRTLK